MKCSVCKAPNATHSYGGALLCTYCYDRYNPTIITVRRWSDEFMLKKEIELSRLKKEIEDQKKYFKGNNKQSVEVKIIK